MSPDRVDARFRIVARVAAGGVGTIYKAHDEATDRVVALKLIEAMGDEDLVRFEREAQALRTLEHAAVVRYVAHGKDGRGRPYLAMEWLEGEDVSRLLARGPLDARTTLVLASRIADALAFTHERGILHRDIKPANLFVVEGRVDAVKLVDFGLARGLLAKSVTGADFSVGTPGYMAPEQLRGEKLDERADIFALGCTLHHCLTGRPPFYGENMMAIITRTLLEEPDPIRDKATGVPPAFADLIGRMIAKPRAGRPRDGVALRAELADLSFVDAAPSPSPVRESSESKLGAMIWVEWSRTDTTVDESALSTSRPTLVGASLGSRLRDVATDRGASVELVLPGALVASMRRAGTLEEQAVHAARCALALASVGDGCSVAVAMIRGEVGGLDEAIERAGDARVDTQSREVLVDDLTATLLPSRFERKPIRGGSFALLGEHDTLDSPRPVLGRTTPFVGRSAELAQLARTTERWFLSAEAGAICITGDMGTGKSRLRQEALQILRFAVPRLSVWTGRADPTSEHAPLSLVSSMLRRLAGLSGTSAEEDRARLVARVRLHASDDSVMRIARFVGEIVGAPFDDGDVALSAARRDRALMGDQMRRSFVDLVEAETRARPLLVVMEDAQWADAASLSFVTAALAAGRRRPFGAWVIGRPELLARHGPRLAELTSEQLSLGDLPSSAAFELARRILPDADELTLGTMLARGPHNPLFIEELARAHGEGKDQTTPRTMLALLESRVDQLEIGPRRALRAASVVGNVFWRGALEAILPEEDRSGLPAALALLVRREWIVERASSRYAGDVELGFRHAALREAVYARFSPEDRRAAHGALAHWLERAGEPDVSAIATHLSLAGRSSAAAEHFARAAHQALCVGEFSTALDHVKHGLDCHPEAELRGRLEVLLAESHRWLNEHEPALAAAESAMAALAPTNGAPGERWFEACGEAVSSASRLRRLDVMARVSDQLLTTVESSEPTPAQVIAFSRAALLLAHAHVDVRAAPLYAYLDRVEERVRDQPLLRGRIAFARAWRAHSLGDWAGYRSGLLVALEAFEAAGDTRTAAQVRANSGHACIELGAYAEAVELLRVVLRDAEASDQKALRALALNNLGLALARTGKIEEAIDCERRAVEGYAKAHDTRLEGASRIYLAAILELAGQLALAETEARRASELLETIPLLLPLALAKLSDLLRTTGRGEEALAVAQRAVRILDGAGRLEGDASTVHLAHAEALWHLGMAGEARDALGRARAELSIAADKIPSGPWRRRFLEAVPSHVRIAELDRTGV